MIEVYFQKNYSLNYNEFVNNKNIVGEKDNTKLPTKSAKRNYLLFINYTHENNLL